MSRRVTKSADRRAARRKAARLSQSGQAPTGVSDEAGGDEVRAELFALERAARRVLLNQALARQGGARIVSAPAPGDVDRDVRSPVPPRTRTAPREGAISSTPESRSIKPKEGT